MLLCLDVGNSQILAGVYNNTGELVLSFRHETQPTITSDKFGIFLRSVLRENNIDYTNIANIAIGSVVPSIDYSLRAACKKYLNTDPFILSPSTTTGIKNKIHNQAETGADLIAAALAAIHIYPQHNIIIVDLGTATTITAVTANHEFLGGAFIPGVNLSIKALSNNTAKLFPVAIVKPTTVIGHSTVEAMQSGAYYGHLGAIKEIIKQMSQEIQFSQKSVDTKPIIIATGGFAYLFDDAKVFDLIKPDLVLDGLYLAFMLNANMFSNKS